MSVLKGKKKCMLRSSLTQILALKITGNATTSNINAVRVDGSNTPVFMNLPHMMKVCRKGITINNQIRITVHLRKEIALTFDILPPVMP